ncbi:hypothetical protein [Mycolicibacterium confluentis]|uniref:Uncharacterized protein n=1 Tax=Mycolicibacterium confluentis TaxID=28047 RepID=A0A7I7Y1W4_9MYCO|nr:hypothetical protein [Mycolicibacterium confluentis]MCV7320579.1 hypothetical protein [Mycolicibacterium confluentis]ORV30232.1 hypothetical protein AWB99_14100 [Mycolicibacterium confluentis]BBZ35618.1 hypothetical protein MCNF_42230 [Mycolicibacterium confluentis]
MSDHRFTPYQEARLETDRLSDQGIPRGVRVTVIELLGDGAYTGVVSVGELLDSGGRPAVLEEIDLQNPDSLLGDIDFTVYDSELTPIEH